MTSRQLSLFDDQRLTLDDAIELSLGSLNTYGEKYRHWVCAYSGGKDSSATTMFVAWAIKSGLIPIPEDLTVLYCDTRMELAVLQRTALQLLAVLRRDGFDARVVLPALDARFFVYMLGRGVPPPSNTFRWCTSLIKINPMLDELANLRETSGEKVLMITGLRLGESAVRDRRIVAACSRDSGECGQGWLQVATDQAVADTLAPLLHWRLCHVYDWIYFDDRHGYDVRDIAAVYGETDARTGCVGCNLASRDTALERLLRDPQWSHLRPLLELRPLYAELKKPRWRKRKALPERRQDGQWSKNVQRMGPLTMEGRAYGLDQILSIQKRAMVDLVNFEEEARIKELWSLDTWPEKWSADDVLAIAPIDVMVRTADNRIAVQALLLRD